MKPPPIQTIGKPKISLPPLHSEQQYIYDHRKRFTVLACGRRFGKTRLIHRLVLEYLLAGKRVGLFYPTRQDATELWRELVQDLKPITADVNNSERKLYCTNGGFLASWSVGSLAVNRVRGTYLDFAAFDEASYIANAEAWRKAVRPLLSDRKGDAVFASSPNGFDWFYDLYRMGQNKDLKNWISFQRSSYDNPLMDTSEFDEAKGDMSRDEFNQEYMAQFISGVGTVFRGVAEISTLNADSLEPNREHSYVMGVDWGRHNDFTAISIIDQTTGEQVFLETFTEIGFVVQRQRIISAWEKWQPHTILAEENNMGEANIEELQRGDEANGIPALPVRGFWMGQTSKAPLIDGLATSIEKSVLAIETEKKPPLTLLRDKGQMLELQAYRREKLPGGGAKYGARKGAHDDTVIALALSWYAAQHMSGGTIDFW